MKHKLIFLVVILMLLVTACNMPANQQAPDADTYSGEEMPSAPAVVFDGQEAPVVDAQPTGGDQRGYVLFSPLRSTDTYLIDYDGNVVYTWPSEYYTGNAAYLLENGNLLRTGNLRNGTFDAGGAGGIVQEIDWDRNVVWEFSYSSDRYLLHHDIERLPNGNILMIAWEYKSADEAVAAGRNPNLLKEGALWVDKIIEVNPATNQIVWEWHVWDHLVQDYDPSKPNYGDPSEHSELINLNYTTMNVADWNHINSVDYNPELDQILLSVHTFSEVWIIDHGATIDESAGLGGDLLYRWGNSQTYSVGSASGQHLFAQHDAQWIEPGLPGAGNILIFNNGDRRSRTYSSIEEIPPPLNTDGSYSLIGARYGPSAPAWSYMAVPATDFYATNISGVQRLPNGNTLICDGPSGRFFEVTPAGETVWEYVNSFGQNVPSKGGNSGGTGNSVFRATYYPAGHAALAGKDLNVALNVVSEQASNAQPQKWPSQETTGLPQIPQAAIQACSGLSQGEACSFDTPKGTLKGTCETTHSQSVCKPQGRP